MEDLEEELEEKHGCSNLGCLYLGTKKCFRCNLWHCVYCIHQFNFVKKFKSLHEFTEYPMRAYICDTCRQNVMMHKRMLEGLMSEEEV